MPPYLPTRGSRRPWCSATSARFNPEMLESMQAQLAAKKAVFEGKNVQSKNEANRKRKEFEEYCKSKTGDLIPFYLKGWKSSQVKMIEKSPFENCLVTVVAAVSFVQNYVLKKVTITSAATTKSKDGTTKTSTVKMTVPISKTLIGSYITMLGDLRAEQELDPSK